MTPPPAASETLHSSAFVLPHDLLHSFFLNGSCSSADILSSKTKTSIRSFYRIFSMAPLIKFCFSLHGGQQPLLLPVRALDDLLELLLIRFHSFLHDRILPCVCHLFSFVLTNTNLMCSFSLHALLAWTSTIPVTSVGHSKYALNPPISRVWTRQCGTGWFLDLQGRRCPVLMSEVDGTVSCWVIFSCACRYLWAFVHESNLASLSLDRLAC